MALNYTMADIRYTSTDKWFDRSSMKFFGDTMKNFRVINQGLPDEDGFVRFYRAAGKPHLIGKSYKLHIASGCVSTDNT